MNAIRQFVVRVRKVGKLRPKTVKTRSMGREREFYAWDIGDDTYIFEKGVISRLNDRPSVLIAEKGALSRGCAGRVMTMSTGNHSVTAFPLLDGRFWEMSHLPSSKRGETLMNKIICANVVSGAIEISQRDIPQKLLYETDDWLLGNAGLTLADVVMGERNEATLHHYRQLGQEWRVKPLAWTEAEMKVALAASRKRIASKINYYHSNRGVHFLSYAEFSRFIGLVCTEPEEFNIALHELVSVFEGNQTSFTRMAKYRGHHEVELFGIQRGNAEARLIPAMESLMEAIALGRIDREGIVARAKELEALFASLLTRPSLADDNSQDFSETLYMYITGEIYSVVGEGSTRAFDDRRTALPGATFVNGRPICHPGADARTKILLSNLRTLTSKDEIVEYANIYEIRDENGGRLGNGSTREITYKTNRMPLGRSLVEKRMSRSAVGYGSYMLARVGVMKALGINLSEYRLLRRQGANGKRPQDYYIRYRCEGEPLNAIPKNYFSSADDATVEDGEVVLALVGLMGDMAAQNMAMKKYDAATDTPLFGIGKEIYEFEYDVAAGRVSPKAVSLCSVRGSFGWPDVSCNEENLRAVCTFYMRSYAQMLMAFQRQHQVAPLKLAERFMDAFEYRTHALAWKLSVMREEFEAYNPDLPRSFNFAKKWQFVMWSLERQERRLANLRRVFMECIAQIG